MKLLLGATETSQRGTGHTLLVQYPAHNPECEPEGRPKSVGYPCIRVWKSLVIIGYFIECCGVAGAVA